MGHPCLYDLVSETLDVLGLYDTSFLGVEKKICLSPCFSTLLPLDAAFKESTRHE